ncbi:hypothetical protein CN193_23735 [Sinorhizobium meliloti]|uniref:hypothetical protein n=1 Tax=Rhizobium meliloti TaxID=382 RepID=UPI000FD74E94|nr:hypothetical protein [Sinorhizobium meliloti]RVI98417.1 hypothetical protein CN193_23735 [Sinorhizobium meliloti]
MTLSKIRPKPNDELVQNYKPLGLKAVVAAHEIKSKSEPVALPAQPIYGRLPEGFHMPFELD